MERIRYACGHHVWIDHTPGLLVTVFDMGLCSDCQRKEKEPRAPREDFARHVRRKDAA